MNPISIAPLARRAAIALFAASIFFGCQSADQQTFKEEVRTALDLYYQGVELQKKRDYGGAREAYLRSAEISPRPRVFYQLAEVAILRNDPDESLAYLDRALAMSPSYENAQRLKRQILARQGVAAEQPARPAAPAPTPERIAEPRPVPEPEEGVSTVTPPPATARPESAAGSGAESAMLAEARQAAAENRWEDCVTLCQRILSADPDNAEAMYRMGVAQFQLGRHAEAEASFQGAIQARPEFADAYNDLGIALEYLGRSAEAMRAYESAIEAGGNSDAYFNLAILEEKRGGYRRAIELYEEYLKTDDTSAFADYARERIGKLRRQAF